MRCRTAKNLRSNSLSTPSHAPEPSPFQIWTFCFPRQPRFLKSHRWVNLPKFHRSVSVVCWGVDNMELSADGDVGRLPVTLAYDLKSAYNNVIRAQMFTQARKRFPTMLRFLNLVYGQAGTLFFTANGNISDYFFCTEGVLQGCPLGLNGLCLALWDFLDELAHVINRNDASGVWIADDLTVVVTRDRAEHIIRTCQVEL